MRHVVSLFALVLGACAPLAVSLPVQSLPLESSATLRAGGVGVRASGGPLFTQTSKAGGATALGARYAPVDTFELHVDAAYYYLPYGDDRAPHAGAGRAGLKWAPVEHFALVAGVGAGAQTHGAFAAADLGFVTGYENPYVVPWGAARVHLSLPIDNATIAVVDEGRSYGVVPTNTWAWQLASGLRIPARVDERATLNVVLGAGILQLRSLEHGGEVVAISAEAALELVLEPPAPPETIDDFVPEAPLE